MKAVFTTSEKKNKKYLFADHFINCEENDIVFFSDILSLNNKKNLKNIVNATTLDLATLPGFGHYSGCHKLNEDIFIIDNDQDRNQPNIHSVYRKKKFVGIFINCGLYHPDDYFEKSLKSKKKCLEHSFKIKDKKLVFFIAPEFQIRFKKNYFKKFNLTFDNFIKDRIEKKKFLEFKVENGKYNIYTFFNSEDVGGHFVELEKKS